MQNVFSPINSFPDDDDFFYEKLPTPMLDVIESPTNVKNLSTKVCSFSLFGSHATPAQADLISIN